MMFGNFFNRRFFNCASVAMIVVSGSALAMEASAQTASTADKDKQPVSVNTAPTGGGIGGASGVGMGTANGLGIGAANGTGVGRSNGTGVGTIRLVRPATQPKLSAGAANGTGFGNRTKKPTDVSTATPTTAPTTDDQLSVAEGVGSASGNGVGTGTGSGTGSGTGTGSGSSNGTGSGTSTGSGTGKSTGPPAIPITYIKELDGKCYYVTPGGLKEYVPATKCDIY